MKVLVYNWKDIKNPDAGGAEIITFELALRLAKEGHNVSWFCRSFKNCLPEEEIEGVKIIRSGGNIATYIKGWIYYRTLKEKPDLVIDMLNTIFWQTPLYATNTKRIAYVNQLAQEVLFYELNPLLSRIFYILEKLQFRTYRKTPFICYANSTKEDLVKIGIPIENIKLFSIGLDHDRYFPGEKCSTPLFICVSRLVRMKRTDLVIVAMSIVVKKHPEAKLVVIGYGYQRESLGKLRNNLNLNNNVFFIDDDIFFWNKSDRDQKVKLMQQAWSLVCPSVKEGWGMTVTECAACGTPAIVSNVSGLRESVKKDETGLVVSSNPSAEELAGSMIKIIEDEALRNKLSKNALEWSKNFSWDKCYKEFRKKVFQIV